MRRQVAPGPPPQLAGQVGRQREHPFRGLGPTGFGIVASASLITALNSTAKFLVMVPFAEWLLSFAQDFCYHAFVGVTILLGAVWARNRFPDSGLRQYGAVFVAVTLAALAAILILEAWETAGTFGTDEAGWMLGLEISVIGAKLVRYTFVGLVIAGAWLYVHTEADHAAAIEQCAVDSARMDQQTAEARLQMLEAQIEPHFLFNTLAHVKRLYETDRAAGARMLRNLKDYLAVALPQMRATESTLGREIDHAIAYLNIQQIRMGRRLAFGIDVPEALRGARMPQLMLLTLVENAIKHGLSPAPEGGRIDVRATTEEGRLCVDVADTGIGFTKSGGSGTGLANIRARLTSQFGPDARLSLTLNTPRGVIARIVLPRKQAGAPGRES